MKKILSLLTVITISTTMVVSAAETTTFGSFLNKLEQKEQEINQKIDAHQKARAEQKTAYEKKQAAQKAEMEKKQAEQRAAFEKKQAELKKQQEANQKALEQAKKDAEARNAERQRVINEEKNYWKGLLNK